MRISGTVEVGDVRLMIDIDAPDHERVICVTNVSPQCLVIPRDRWLLDHTDLSASALAELNQANVRTLGDAVDESWQVRLPKNLVHLSDEVQNAVDRLRSLALTFDQESAEEVHSGLHAFPVSENPERRHAPTAEQPPLTLTLSRALVGPKPREEIKPESDLASLGLAAPLIKVLGKIPVVSVGQLISRGRRQTMMTVGVKASDLSIIEQKLNNNGFQWPT